VNVVRLALASLALAATACRSSGSGTAAGTQSGSPNRLPSAAERAARDREAADERRASGLRLPRYPSDFSRFRPLTRAERTNFTETSRHADVVAFIDSLRTLGSGVHVTSLGRSGQGRDIPVVIASRPLVRTATEAKRLNRPIVFVQGNIHGGEVEGKEALLSLLRDLLVDRNENVLDSLVLVAVPLYNPDGNEAFGPQERNRGSQNGPAIVGQRPNADTLDLNRDYIKAEAPETRAALAFFNVWEPDVFVDLHATNGSYHGFALTYSPSLNPAAFVGGPFARDTLLAEVRRRMRIDYRTEVFDYGNFVSQDSVERGWYTYDHRPRFGTNYYGLRGRPSILAEAYSHDPFDRRIASTYHFLRETLSLIGERGDEVLQTSAEADRRSTGWGTLPASSPRIPVRSEIVSVHREVVRAEVLERTGDSARTEAGVPRGMRRTGRYRAVQMPIYDRFAGTLFRTLPNAYAFGAEEAGVMEQLRRHGIFVEKLDVALELETEHFVVDSVIRSPRPFQKHNEVRLQGRWAREKRTLPAGTFIVRTGQPLAVLALYLLEPESDDGLATWNVFDRSLRVGAPFPVVRVLQPLLGGVSEAGR